MDGVIGWVRESVQVLLISSKVLARRWMFHFEFLAVMWWLAHWTFDQMVGRSEGCWFEARLIRLFIAVLFP